MTICAICGEDIDGHSETRGLNHLDKASRMIATMKKSIDEHNCNEKVFQL